jgi:adenylate kinase family enzyme
MEQVKVKKIVIVINGSGGVGKDTLCEIVGKYYNTINVSSVDPIKEIAYKNGWNGDKSAKSRKFLADLKKIFVEFNNLPGRYLQSKYEEFVLNDRQIMFVHIREPKEIEKFKASIDLPCITLLIQGRETTRTVWKNSSDDDVENYNYDFYYKNHKPLDEVEKDFIEFFNNLLKKIDNSLRE